MELKDKISKFIESRIETNYWDFKREPHSNNASLLHDIISLANSVTSHDKYLIIGVADPRENCEIVGVQENQENRKSQAELIDFLRSKSFAGGIRPEIQLSTIEINDKNIDVIRIFNRPFKPYFLSADYRCQEKLVKANYIYTRIQDTNTPIDKSAELNHIELMWRDRFGLTVAPADRFKFLLLETNRWELDPGNKNYAYYKPQPEYRIEFEESNKGHEPYELLMINPEFYYGNLKLLYHSTIMHESLYIWLDGMRLITAVPTTGSIDLERKRVYFYYFNLMVIDGLLHYLFQNSQLKCESRGHDANFIYFRNKSGINEFERYVTNNQEEFWNIEPDYLAKEANKKLKTHNSMGDTVDLENLNRIYKMWKEWYTHNNVHDDHVG